MADLNSLVIFAKVVEAKSFSEAARRLKMPVSTVSRRVADLEEQLGVRLLERSTRSLRLTDVGADVLAARAARRRTERGGGQHRFEYICRTSRARCGSRRRPTSPTRCWRRWSAPSRRPTRKSGSRCSSRRADRRSDRRGRRPGVQGRRARRLVARRAAAPDLPASARGEPRLSGEAGRRTETPQDLLDHRLLAFSFWTPESHWLFRAGGEGAGDADVTAASR